MHSSTLNQLKHSHDFSLQNQAGERRTVYVLVLTSITMVVEIVAGGLFGSMALLADGWHMGTHVAAFMIALFAYRYARRHADDPAFSFGTGKVNVLGGFASAVALAVVALVMVVESVQRFFEPHAIHFNEAIFVAVLGLLVNLASAVILQDGHHHHHDHDHDHDVHHHDHNLRAAYMHVLADALTSVLAIVALLAGKYFGWNWLDPIMGIVGAAIIMRWGYGLVAQSGPVLLDASIRDKKLQRICDTLESHDDVRISDIHVWRVSGNHYAAIIALVTHNPQPADFYKALLRDFTELTHLTIEVNCCAEVACQGE